MNYFTFRFLSFRFHFLIAVFLAFAFSACKKTDTVDPTLSAIRVVNASPSSATYNVYLSGSLINSAELPFAGSLSYVQKTAGAYSLKFTTGSSVESLLTKSITMSQSVYQSFFLINKPGTLDGLYVNDDLSVASADKAYIRFVNLSPDAQALDLAKTGASSALITNKAFKVASGFISIDPGTYSFDAKDTSTGLVKTTLSSTTFVAGYHYDVICAGLITPANDTERALTLQALLIK